LLNAELRFNIFAEGVFMRIHEDLKSSLKAAEANRRVQLAQDAEVEETRRIEAERKTKITEACRRAKDVANDTVRPTSNKERLQLGGVVDFISPWVPVVTNNDGSVLEARLHGETALLDLSSGGKTKMMRVWGKYFDGKHAEVWTDFRLGMLVEHEMVYSDSEEATLRFSEEEGRIISSSDGIPSQLEPDTEDWSEMERIIDLIQRTGREA
jgi:hypothetical protein